MGTSGRVPYVDIVINPVLRATLRKRQLSFSPAPSSSLESDNANFDSPPRKKKKFDQELDSENELSDNLSHISLDRPLSPTVSEYTLEAQDQVSSGQDDAPDRGLRRRRVSSDSPASLISHQDSQYYTPTGDEVLEDGELEIPGETTLEEEEELESTIPIRMLSDYTIYNLETKRVIAVDELLQLDYCREHFAASGLVGPWFEADENRTNEGDGGSDDVDNDTSASEIDRVTLTKLVEFSVHASSEEDLLDPKIYVRTEFAWYILGCPAQSYHAYFAPFWTRHRLLHLLVMGALENKYMTYEQFIRGLSDLDEAEDSVATAQLILGRHLREEDLASDDTTAYIISVLPDVCASNGIRIASVPAIRSIMGTNHHSLHKPSMGPRQSKKKKPFAVAAQKHLDPEKEVLKHRSKTFLTDIVNQIAKNLFEVSLDIAESQVDHDDGDDGIHIKLPRFKAHYSNPSDMSWGEKFKDSGKFYWSVQVDGVLYEAGDVVMVEPGDENSPAEVLKASQTSNKYGNRYWFCQIRYFFDQSSRNGPVKMFHGLWFSHGSKTLLQETSHSRALYLLKQCDDNPVSSIFRKCNFHILQPSEPEMVDDGNHDPNNFFCSHLYDRDSASFLDIPDSALMVDQEGPAKSCYSCTCQIEEDTISQIALGPEAITIYGTTYHMSDFVYIHPESTSDSKLLKIGQITGFQNENVHITLLGRYDDHVNYRRKQDGDDCNLAADERRLYLTDKSKLISADQIDGLCYVLHLTDTAKIQAWTQQDDHFYLSEAGNKEDIQPIKQKDFHFCQFCYQADLKRAQNVKRFLRTNSKLIGMELFSGAGGLGTGMDMSGFVETRYAVEFSPSAAMTYKRNHPQTEVYCQDTSSLLKYAITGKNSDGLPEPPLSNIDNRTRCRPLPKKNDGIDFIFGGPPCQSFSQANHTKRRDDIRSTLTCNMLSYVEWYEPTYFLLENVSGFLDHKFYTTRETKTGEVESEIRSGMVKFVMRTLIALGYQVHFRLLQSGQYGIPQSRRRVIFWAARRGVPLPDFPIPVYAFPTTIHRVKLPTEELLDPPTRCKIPGTFHHFAPLKARTVNDAISDLPCFDWINPHQIIPETSKSRQAAQRRQAELNIPAFEATAQGQTDFNQLPGYPMGALYLIQPQNSYQRWLRKGMTEDSLITGQYTTWMNSKVIEATTNVPLRPLADHRDLPSSLLPNHAKPEARKKNRTFYGRMDGDGYFRCAVTTLSPVLKNQWPVHPSQKRIITVREAARSQGFPDNYVFESCNTAPSKVVQDQLRQIGNAVAVPFALALGKELGKAMVLRWEAREREGSVPL